MTASFFIYLTPIIASVIGWFTNFLAVKMLFYPKKPTKILFFEIQGIFPKRQKVLAERLGSIVSEELVSVEELRNQILKQENLDAAFDDVEVQISDFLNNKLPEMLPTLIQTGLKEREAKEAAFSSTEEQKNTRIGWRDLGKKFFSSTLKNDSIRKWAEERIVEFVKDESVKKSIKELTMNEIRRIAPIAINDFVEKAEEKIDIKQMVYEKVAEFSSDKLEEIVQAILEKEFKFIEIVGAILGFLIGLINLGLILLSQ
ncbi:MAG: DUF445 domain-containing protein [Chitinophagales bacterium]